MNMKRVLMAIFFAFLSITFVAGGVCLLQGCSQSTPKDGGGGISDSPENPNDEDNTKVDGYNITVTFNANGGAIIASSNCSGLIGFAFATTSPIEDSDMLLS